MISKRNYFKGGRYKQGVYKYGLLHDGQYFPGDHPEVSVEVFSSQSKVSVVVDGTQILENSLSGKDGRILIFAIKDEASYHLREAARNCLKNLGSKYSYLVGWRDMWVFVAQKGGKPLGEEFSKANDFGSWANPASIKVNVLLSENSDADCNWIDSPDNKRRREFCSQVEGYGTVCSCTNPAPVKFPYQPLEHSVVENIPIIVLASDRPHYLYRTITSLLRVRGVNASLVEVFIDGYFTEPAAVADLFGLNVHQHAPSSVGKGRVSQHLKTSLTSTLNMYPESKYLVVLEDDVDVSPDFLSYMNQTLWLLDIDDTLYCISAWNDHGYEHSSYDKRLLYRTESHPGLGWAIRSEFYKKELESRWPTPEKVRI
ncbi:hypothetical protein QYM36_001876 [Artemia franciscana]|uniref:Alpha-1,3-mannosyl-glycoprotein 2-beta-N-acetylglucosaminyltransferase n=1 Tax=Artemia franciscana TaxID=6661 RepID=A0AA88LGB6_ARTSF|nr:hypothetical protein QYM36_001876 [Artemia franciscana]